MAFGRQISTRPPNLITTHLIGNFGYQSCSCLLLPLPHFSFFILHLLQLCFIEVAAVIAHVEFIHFKLGRFPLLVIKGWDLEDCHNLGQYRTPEVQVFSRKRNSAEMLYLKPFFPNSNRRVLRIFQFFLFLAASQTRLLPFTACRFRVHFLHAHYSTFNWSHKRRVPPHFSAAPYCIDQRWGFLR